MSVLFATFTSDDESVEPTMYPNNEEYPRRSYIFVLSGIAIIGPE
jgi:hypothetical protein